MEHPALDLPMFPRKHFFLKPEIRVEVKFWLESPTSEPNRDFFCRQSGRKIGSPWFDRTTSTFWCAALPQFLGHMGGLNGIKRSPETQERGSEFLKHEIDSAWSNQGKMDQMTLLQICVFFDLESPFFEAFCGFIANCLIWSSFLKSEIHTMISAKSGAVGFCSSSPSQSERWQSAWFSVDFYLEGSSLIVYIYIYTWNPIDLYFWRSTPQNKAFSNQNKGHLGSRYIYYIYI